MLIKYENQSGTILTLQNAGAKLADVYRKHCIADAAFWQDRVQ